MSGGGTNLQAVLDAQDAGRIPHGRVVCVVSSKPDVYALERARRHNIDTAVANRKELGDQAVFESAILETFRRHDVEMVVCAGFLSILSPDFVRQYPDRIINVHPALIPSFCGKGFYGLHVHEAVSYTHLDVYKRQVP